ncbi:hypothetical protein KUTeg_001636 [Tegillarca granosa]|uniref:Copper type II ascorbate-dependent monooxygenase N-terminal domain-containing protein n=1 Tax=Tegillarca granosa TaxID=220873 RepID=A0ABQ9FS02_TEGGR|nr:hypothetical protein KUTeg_001636 [Tegillarca granosa]
MLVGICDNIGGGICPGLTMDGCPIQPPQMQQPSQFIPQNQRPPNTPSQFMPPNQRQPPVMQPNPNQMSGGQTWGGPQTNPIPNQMPPQTQFGGVNPRMQQPPMQPMPNQQNGPFNGGNGFSNNQNFQPQPQAGFPNQVPATQDVTYACVVVDAPLDSSYHVIASSPVIDNVAVVHSMNVYGCKREICFESYQEVNKCIYLMFDKYVNHISIMSFTGTETTAVPISNSPFKCSLEPIAGCNEFITGYSPSYQDVCFHRGTGVRVGRMGFRKVMLQVLWSNPSRIAGGTDSSGMNLYITSRLRQNNLGVATLKVAQFSLPPWQPSYEIKAACSPECSTVQIKKPIYITGGINYMNMLGRDQKIEVLRNGNIVALVTKDQNLFIYYIEF